MTSFTCTSRQARTQRVHWMHASRFTADGGCDRSAFGCSLSESWLANPERCARCCLLSSVYSCSGMSEQELEHHLLRGERARRIGGDFHALRREAAARGREHALALISTTQARQLPSERWLPPWHRCGMSTPCFFAVVMIGSSGRPTTVSPFSLNSIGIIASWPSLIRSMSEAFYPAISCGNTS